MKSTGAILAGILVNVILSTATDYVLQSTGVFPTVGQGEYISWMLALALAYRLVYTFAGGYVTARLAPDRPMWHVKILGTLGTVLGAIGVFVGWNLSEHWYPIALALTAYPATYLGGKMTNPRLNH